jgi:phosphatidate cytidylyltransferase
MKRVLTAVVLVPLVLLAVFRAPWWLFAALLLLLIILTVHEYLGIMRGYGIRPLRWAVYTACILAGLFSSVSWLSFLLAMLGEYLMNPWFLFWIPFLLFGIILVFRKDMRMALPAASASAFAAVYIAMPLGLLGALREGYGAAVVFVLISVWAGDTAAYYVGRSLGKHKLAPVVSPNKTWEGAVASLIASIAVAVLVCRFRAPISHWFARSTVFLLDRPTQLPRLESLPWLQIVIVGVLTNIAAQFGDLFESAIKRGAQMKDSGSLVPGHGGILDRIDALLFAIPAVWLYVKISGLLESFVHNLQPLFDR